MLFEIGIPNLVCVCILGCQSAQYHFRVNLMLTYDLVSRITVAGAYCTYYLMQESQIYCVFSSWHGRVMYTILVYFDLTLTSDLISSFFVSGAYILYNK